MLFFSKDDKCSVVKEYDKLLDIDNRLEKRLINQRRYSRH